MKQYFTHKRLPRLYFIMRVSFVNLLLLVIPCLQVLSAEKASGQSMRDTFVRIDAENVSLKTIFKIIEDQSEFLFVYSPEVIEAYDYVSFKNDHISVAEALDEILHNLPIAFKKSNHNILLFRTDIDDVDQTEIISIEGRVVGTDGTPLPGVNVVVKGTTIGTTTAVDGYYAIDMPAGSNVLVFSFIGFRTQEISVSAQTNLNITLEEDVMSLAEVEVVSTGYWTDTKEKSTGSIVKVTAKEIERQPVTNPLMALQGRVPGLEITPRNGTPGVAPVVRIRGTNSLRVEGKGSTSMENDGNYPLYVIDGVPVNSTPLSSYGGSYTADGYDPLSTISPGSIESIEILKDGDATAIYGSRGANGVILITTKRKSKSAQPTSLDFSGYSGIGRISRRLKLLNTQQYLSMRAQAFENDGLTPGPFDPDMILWEQDRYTDWQKVLLGGSANINDLQANLSSGNNNTTFQFGGGLHKETLIFPGDFSYKRAAVRLSVNHKSTDNKFNFAVSANYGLDDSKLFNDANGLLQAALSLAPNAPRLYNSDGSLNWEQRVVNGQVLSSWINPLSSQRNVQNTNTKNLVSSANLSYQLLPDVSVSVSGGYTDLSNSEKGKYPASAQPPERPALGIANFLTNQRSSWIIEPKISYSIKLSDHLISVLLGGTLQNSTSNVTVTTGQQYASDALLGSLLGAGQINSERDDNYQYKYTSLYARLGYNLKQRYLLNITGRRDGSSRFGPGNRFGNFGAAGVAWIVSKEPFFMPLKKILNLAKVRGSYGLTGSDQIGDYRYYELYNISKNRFAGQPGFTPSALANADFAWEVTNKLEAAIELGFLENQFGLELNWYLNRSSNQLVDYTLSAVTGFPSILSNFPATVENTGLEAVLRSELLSSGDFRWTLSLNTSIPRNRLVKFEGLENSPYATQYRLGEPLSVRQVYTYTGIDPETGLYSFEDRNRDGLINRADYSLQNPNKKAVYGGISNDIQYKGFELSFLIQFSRQNGDRYFAASPPGRQVNQPINVLNSWHRPEDNVSVQRLSTTQAALVSYVNLIGSNYSMVDASFIRLKTVSLAYRLAPGMLEKLHFQEAKVFLQGQNIFTITKYQGLDPETGNTLPPLRMITVGVQCKL